MSLLFRDSHGWDGPTVCHLCRVSDGAILHTSQLHCTFYAWHCTVFQAFGVFNSSLYSQIASEKVRIDVTLQPHRYALPTQLKHPAYLLVARSAC